MKTNLQFPKSLQIIFLILFAINSLNVFGQTTSAGGGLVSSTSTSTLKTCAFQNLILTNVDTSRVKASDFTLTPSIAPSVLRSNADTIIVNITYKDSIIPSGTGTVNITPNTLSIKDPNNVLSSATRFAGVIYFINPITKRKRKPATGSLTVSNSVKSVEFPPKSGK